MQRTISTGSTITVSEPRFDGNVLIHADHPDAPADMRNVELGRIAEQPGRGYGFQPAPFSAALLSPEALRTIADMIEEWTK